MKTLAFRLLCPSGVASGVPPADLAASSATSSSTEKRIELRLRPAPSEAAEADMERRREPEAEVVVEEEGEGERLGEVLGRGRVSATFSTLVVATEPAIWAGEGQGAQREGHWQAAHALPSSTEGRRVTQHANGAAKRLIPNP
jgi:hypothetical protein